MLSKALGVRINVVMGKRIYCILLHMNYEMHSTLPKDERYDLFWA